MCISAVSDQLPDRRCAQTVLACSIFESLGDFAADVVRRLVRDWKADAIVCAGHVFPGNNILRVRTGGALTSMPLPMHFPAIGRI